MLSTIALVEAVMSGQGGHKSQADTKDDRKNFRLPWKLSEKVRLHCILFANQKKERKKEEEASFERD